MLPINSFTIFRPRYVELIPPLNGQSNNEFKLRNEPEEETKIALISFFKSVES